MIFNRIRWPENNNFWRNWNCWL